MEKLIKYLDKVIYWSIVLIPFSMAIAPAITHTFIGLAIFSFVIKKIVRKENLFFKTSVNIPYLLLFLVACASITNSSNYGDSLHGMFKLARNAFLVLICAQEIKDKGHIKRIALFIILGATLSSFDALWQLVSGKDFIRGNEIITNIGLSRVTAAFPNANVLGVYLSAISPLIIGLSLYYFKNEAKFMMLVISILVTTTLIFTFSRGTGMAFYCAILLVAVFRKNKPVIAALLAILLLFPFIMPRNIKNWSKEINYNPVVFMLNSDRISVYRNTLNMIKHHPFFGVGINTFSQNYPLYKLPEPADAKTGEHMYAHNNFLHMTGEVGLAGLAAFLWFLFALFREGFRLYWSLKDEYLKLVSLLIIACIWAFLINGLTETSLYYSRVSMIFWYLIGILLSLRKFINVPS